MRGRGNLAMSPAAYTSPSAHRLLSTTTSPRPVRGRPDSFRKLVAGTTPTPAITTSHDRVSPDGSITPVT